MSFQGFSPDALAWLRELAANNDREWFAPRKADYERLWVEPAKGFVFSLGARLRSMRAGMAFDPRVGGSILRIHRDTRFSADKSPYKTHVDLWFWEGADKGWDNPGLFIRVQPDNLVVGVGQHVFGPERLAAFRAAVVDETRGHALEEALHAVTPHYALGGTHYQRVPRGLPADHPRGWLLRHNGLYAATEGPVPPELHRSELADLCAEHFRRLLPLHAWLVGFGA